MRASTACCSRLVLASGAAGGGDDNERGGKVSGDVSFMVFGDPEEIQGYQDMIAAYENEQPDVNVEDDRGEPTATT